VRLTTCAAFRFHGVHHWFYFAQSRLHARRSAAGASKTSARPPSANSRSRLRGCLPAALLARTDEGPNSRQRVFALGLTLECFIWQRLKPKTACREVVRHVQTLVALAGLDPIDEGDSAYIQARLRLPKDRLEQALAATAQTADRRAGTGGRLQGRPVKVVDGSSTQLADTPKNQKRYPQPATQKRGCGFPLMKFVVLMSLTSGAVLTWWPTTWSGVSWPKPWPATRWSWSGSVSKAVWTPCAFTARPSAKPVIKPCAANYGAICCTIWPATWGATAPTVLNPGRSNAAQNRIHCSISHAANSWKFPIAVVTGKDAPENFGALN
jgi:hypothetical protein